MPISEQHLTCTVSLGITVFPEDSEDTDTLLRCADLAMYRAKEDGKNQFRFFEQEREETRKSVASFERPEYLWQHAIREVHQCHAGRRKSCKNISN